MYEPAGTPLGDAADTVGAEPCATLLVVEEEGPDSASVTAFVRVNEPPPLTLPLKKTVLPLLKAEPAGLTPLSDSEFAGTPVSTIATFDGDDEPTLPTLSVSCSRYW